MSINESMPKTPSKSPLAESIKLTRESTMSAMEKKQVLADQRAVLQKQVDEYDAWVAANPTIRTPSGRYLNNARLPEGMPNVFQIQQIKSDLNLIDQDIATYDAQIAAEKKAYDIANPVGVTQHNPQPSSVAPAEGSVTTPAYKKIANISQAREARNAIIEQAKKEQIERARAISEAAKGPKVGDTGPNGGIIEQAEDGKLVERVPQPDGVDEQGRQKFRADILIPVVTTGIGAFAGSVIPGLGTAAGAMAGYSFGSGIVGYLNAQEQQGIIDENMKRTYLAYIENQAKLETAKKVAQSALDAAETAGEYAILSSQLDAISALQSGQQLSEAQIASLGVFIDQFSSGNAALADEVKGTFALQNKMIEDGTVEAAKQLGTGLGISEETLVNGMLAGRGIISEGQTAAQGQIDTGFGRAYDLTAGGYNRGLKQLGQLGTDVTNTIKAGSAATQDELNAGYGRGINTFGVGGTTAAGTITEGASQANKYITTGMFNANQAAAKGFDTATGNIMVGGTIAQQQAGGGYDQAIATLKGALENTGLNVQQQMDVINKGSDSPYYTEALKGFKAFAESALNPNSDILNRRIATSMAQLNKQLAAKGITGGAAARAQSDLVQKITDEEATKQVGYQRDLASFGIQQQQLDQALNEARVKILSSGVDAKNQLVSSISQAQAQKGIQTSGITMEMAKQVADYAAQKGISEYNAAKEMGLAEADLFSKASQNIANIQQRTSELQGQAQIDQTKAVADVISKSYGDIATLQTELGKLGVNLTVDQATALADTTKRQAELSSGLTERTALNLADSVTKEAQIKSANELAISNKLADYKQRLGEDQAQNLGQSRQLYANILQSGLERELGARTQGALTLAGNADMYSQKTADILTRGGEALSNLYTGTATKVAGIETGTAENQAAATTNYTNTQNQAAAAKGAVDEKGTASLMNAVAVPLMYGANAYGKTTTPTVDSSSGLTTAQRISANWNSWVNPSGMNGPYAPGAYDVQQPPTTQYTPPTPYDYIPTDYTPATGLPAPQIPSPSVPGDLQFEVVRQKPTISGQETPTISSSLNPRYTTESNLSNLMDARNAQNPDLEYVKNIGWVKKNRPTISSGLSNNLYA